MISEPTILQGDLKGRGRPELLSFTLLAFALSLFVFLLAPPFLKGDVGDVHGFTGQELMDLVTPLVAMPLLFLAFELTGPMGLRVRSALVALLSAWVVGQAIHLASNAIGDVLPAGTERDAFYATSAGRLDEWLDEVLSHWIWHVAWMLLLGLLLWLATRRPVRGDRTRPLAVSASAVAGLIQGFTWFVVTDEGGTWLLALPATAALLLGAWLMKRLDADRVVTTFLLVGSLVTLLLYAIWIAWQGWEPVPICKAFPC